MSPGLTLNWAAQDAEDVAALFQGQEGKRYSSVQVRLLTDRRATTGTILAGLDWLRLAMTKGNDRAVIFLAGHGVTDERQQFYFLPARADPNDLAGTAVSRDAIAERVAQLRGRVVMFIDACHSAAGLEGAGWGRAPADLDDFVNDFTRPEIGAIMFASSTGAEVSIERKEWRNGAFTEALVEGLNHAADFTGDGGVSTGELNVYLTARVGDLSGGVQTPVMHKSRAIPDFRITSVR